MNTNRENKIKMKVTRKKKENYIEVFPDNWTQKFEPHGGQISKP